jgi:hypothetical protein
MPLFKLKKGPLLEKYLFCGNKCDIYKYFCPYTYPRVYPRPLAEGKGFARVQKFQPLPLPSCTLPLTPGGFETP